MTFNDDAIAMLTARYRSTAAEISEATGRSISWLYIAAMKIAACEYPCPREGQTSSDIYCLVNQITALRSIRRVFVGTGVEPMRTPRARAKE